MKGLQYISGQPEINVFELMNDSRSLLKVYAVNSINIINVRYLYHHLPSVKEGTIATPFFLDKDYKKNALWSDQR